MATGQWTGVGGVARQVKGEHFGVGSVAREVKNGYVGVGSVARLFYQSCGTTDITSSVSPSNVLSTTYSTDKHVSLPKNRGKWASLDNNRSILVRRISNYFYIWIFKNSGGITVSSMYTIEDNTNLSTSSCAISYTLIKLSENKIVIFYGGDTISNYSTITMTFSDMTMTYTQPDYSTPLGCGSAYDDGPWFRPYDNGVFYLYKDKSDSIYRYSFTFNSSGSITEKTGKNEGSLNHGAMPEYSWDCRTILGGACVATASGSPSMNYNKRPYTSITLGAVSMLNEAGTSYSFFYSTTSAAAITFYNDLAYVAGTNGKIYVICKDGCTTLTGAREAGTTVTNTNMYDIFMNISKTKLALIYSNDSGENITVNFYNINSDHSLTQYHTESFAFFKYNFVGSNGDYFYLIGDGVNTAKVINL